MKKLLAIFMSIVMIISLISCPKKPKNQASNSLSDTIHITYAKAPLNVPLIIAKNMKIYEDNFAAAKEPRSVQFHELSTESEQIEALAAQKIDFISVLDASQAIVSAANGSSLCIIGVFSRAPKTFSIQTNKENIKSITDLKGKKIAGPKGTILHQLLEAALQKEGLSINDVDFIPMTQEEALSTMKAGKVDAALLKDKAMMQGLAQGARILTDGENLIEGTTLIATRKEIFEHYPDVIDTYLDAHRKSVKAMVDNWQEAINLTAQELGISSQEVEENINLYDFDMVIKPNDKIGLAKTQQFLIDNGMLDHPTNIEELVVTNW